VRRKRKWNAAHGMVLKEAGGYEKEKEAIKH
jgi:hypothetical protein